MPSETLTIKFHGPFSWSGNGDTTDIFTSDLGKKAGVYLWTVKHEKGELICYVGETVRSFSARLLDHFEEHMSGGYHIYEPKEYLRGAKDKMLWSGRYDPKRRTTVAQFLQKLSDLKGPIEELALLYRFYIAPVEYKSESRIRKELCQRIEAAIARHLRQQEPPIGPFQEDNVRYRTPHERDIPIQVFIEPDPRLLGIPHFLFV